jgi:hypothetical protein
MPHGRPPSEDAGPTQGLAGGPGPSPPGVDDRTPRAAVAGDASEHLPPDEAPDEAQEEKGGTAGRKDAVPEGRGEARPGDGERP